MATKNVQQLIACYQIWRRAFLVHAMTSLWKHSMAAHSKDFVILAFEPPF